MRSRDAADPGGPVRKRREARYPGMGVADALVFLAICLAGAPVRAEDSFLGISFGGRALALGSAYTAVADDAQAVLWNPAGLAQVSHVSVSGSQNHLSFTDNAYSLCTTAPAGRWGVLAVSVQELNAEDVTLTRPVLDANGNPVLDPATNTPLLEITGLGRETDGTFLIGWGAEVARWLLVGGAGKWLVGNAGGVLGSGLGAGGGVLIRLPGGWRLGAAAEDIGRTTVRWEDRTRTVLDPAGRLGVSWRFRPAWLVSAEARSPLLRAEVTTAFGAEWKFADYLAFRAGLEDFRATGGAGFRMPLGQGGRAFASADYAFVTGSRFEDRNRLTLTVGF